MRHLTRAILVAAALGVMAAPAWAADGGAAPATKAAPAAAPAAPAAAPAASAPAETAPATKAPETPAEGVSEGAAKEGETQAWWKAITVFLIEVSTALALPLLIVLAMVANKKWKLGLERDTIEWVVSKAVGFGEQKAKVALKDGKPMEGPKILEAALGHGTSLLVTKGLAAKWGDKLADLIEAKLGEQEAASAAPKPKTAEGQPAATAEG